MRPRPLSRGNVITLSVENLHCARFNEAAAVKPRKPFAIICACWHNVMLQ